MPQQNKKNDKVVIVSGPSGVGKSTICREAVKRLDAFLSVSATTRPKTDRETDGVDYWFISRQDFKQRIEQKDFLEYARVFGNYYGTPKQPVLEALRQRKTVILEIDAQGALQVKKVYPDALMIFILPPSQGDLASRITNRGRESDRAKEQRLEGAGNEIAQAWRHYGHMVINEELAQAINETVGIIKKSFAEEPND